MELVAEAELAQVRQAGEPAVVGEHPAAARVPARAVAALLASLLVFALANLPFIPAEFPSDEGDNLLGGWLMSEGQVVYRDFFSQHPPLGYFLSALVTLLFGRNWVVHRYAVALLGLLCLGYLLVRLIRGPDRTLFYAVAMLAVLWPVYGVIYWSFLLLNDNLAAYPYLLGFGLVANALWNRVPLSRLDAVVLGLGAYLAVFANPFTLFPILALLPAYIYGLWLTRTGAESGLSAVRRGLGWALAGGGVPLALTAGYFLATRSLGDAWYWVVTFNRSVYGTHFDGCPTRLWPELRHQLTSLLDLFGTVSWDYRWHFGEPSNTWGDDRWVCFGLAGRVAIVALGAAWLVMRRRILALTLFAYAAAALLRQDPVFHVQHFRLLELFAQMVLLAVCLRWLLRARPAPRVLACAVVAVLVAVQVTVASRTWATLRRYQEKTPIRVTLHPEGLSLMQEAKRLTDLMGGDGRLLTYPVYYQLNHLTGFKPAGYFYACVPWTMYRPEDRARVIADVRRAAAENTIILLGRTDAVRKYPVEDFARELIDVIEQEYVEIQPCLYVSRQNPNSRRPALRKEPLPPRPDMLEQMTWSGNLGEGTGDHPWLTYTLGKPEYVHRVQIRYVLSNADGAPARFRAWWRLRGTNDFEGEGRRCYEWTLPTGPEEHAVCLPVWEAIDQFRIEPDARPCRFEIRSIEVVK